MLKDTNNRYLWFDTHILNLVLFFCAASYFIKEPGAFNLVFAILLLLTYIGLLRRKGFGWYLVEVLSALYAFFSLVVGLCAIFYLEGGSALPVAILFLLVASFCGFRFLYYRKRKELFIQKKEKKNTLKTMVINSTHNYECPLCGKDLEKDARFCPYCGANLEEMK